MILLINTKDKNKISISLQNKGKVLEELTDFNQYGSQALLPLIQKILKKHNLGFKDIKEIKVEKGPGSFTGLRVGVSVANALAFALGVSVNGKKAETDLIYA